jgi:hypothetical protein
MFPPLEVQLILDLTNYQLRSAGLNKETTKGEILNSLVLLFLHHGLSLGKGHRCGR